MHSALFWQGEWVLNDEPLILFIAGESVLREPVKNSLWGTNEAGILHASTLQHGMEMLYALEPELIITALDLPDGSGLQFVATLQRENMPTSIIIVSAGQEPHAPILTLRQRIDVCRMPFQRERLRHLVNERLKRLDSGVPVAVSRQYGQSATLIDYILLGCMSRHSMQIHLIQEKAVVGVVCIHRGDLWSAEDRVHTGEVALQGMLDKNVRIEVHPILCGEQGPRSLEAPAWRLITTLAAKSARRDRTRTSDGRRPDERLTKMRYRGDE